MESTTVTQPVVLTSEAVDALPEIPVGDLNGVTHKVLWQTADSMAGVLTVDAGHRLGSHAHRTNHHHVWVLTGNAVVLGQSLDAGSYVHIPAGVDHDIDATATDGCTVFYLYAR
jgi:uncharacterized RmlC-like cupin family protein